MVLTDNKRKFNILFLRKQPDNICFLSECPYLKIKKTLPFLFYYSFALYYFKRNSAQFTRIGQIVVLPVCTCVYNVEGNKTDYKLRLYQSNASIQKKLL